MAKSQIPSRTTIVAPPTFPDFFKQRVLNQDRRVQLMCGLFKNAFGGAATGFLPAQRLFKAMCFDFLGRYVLYQDRRVQLMCSLLKSRLMVQQPDKDSSPPRGTPRPPEPSSQISPPTAQETIQQRVQEVVQDTLRHPGSGRYRGAQRWPPQPRRRSPL